MKGFFRLLVTVLVAMVISCSLNSLFMELGWAPKMQPGQLGTQVTGTVPMPNSPNRRDAMYGDFVVTDRAARPTGHATRIIDDQADHQLEFPTSW